MKGLPAAQGPLSRGGRPPSGPRGQGQRGFTLLEVLVAIAIMGVSLGVLLSGLALGHRQTLRGDMAVEATSIAEGLLHEVRGDPEGLEPREGDVDGHAGWRYRLETGDVVVRLWGPAPETDTGPPSEPEAGAEIEAPELVELTLTILPPGRSPPFVLTTWLPRQDL